VQHGTSPQRQLSLLHNIIDILLKALIVEYTAFPTIAEIALIVGIVKKTYHNDITKYVANVTKTSQLKRLPCDGRREKLKRNCGKLSVLLPGGVLN
jgi:hypothetical protein